MSLLVISILTIPVPLQLSIPLAGIIVATEPLPDYDMKTSLIEHRGYSHTFIAAILVATLLTAIVIGVIALLTRQAATLSAQSGTGMLTTLFPPVRILLTLIFCGTIIGFISHFLGDMITVGTGYHGVQPFSPLSSWEAPIQLCSADDRLWNGGLLTIGSVAVVLSGYVQYHIFLGGV